MQRAFRFRLEHRRVLRHERFLHVPVEVRVLQPHAGELLALAGEQLGALLGRRQHEVVQADARERLLHQLAVRAVEDDRVERVERDGGDHVRVALGELLPVQLVARVKGTEVALDRELPVDDGVLRAEVRLVEVVRVLHVRRPQPPVEAERRVRADEHGHGAGPTGRTGRTLRVHRNVAAHDQRQPSVPARRFNPVDRVQQRGRPAVARVRRVDSLQVGDARRFEQLHQHRLDALRLVHDRLRADLEPADPVQRNLVPIEQVAHDRQAQRVDVLPVGAEAHALLAQPDRVLARRHPIERLQLRLVDELRGEDDLQRHQSNPLGPLALPFAVRVAAAHRLSGTVAHTLLPQAETFSPCAGRLAFFSRFAPLLADTAISDHTKIDAFLQRSFVSIAFLAFLSDLGHGTRKGKRTDREVSFTHKKPR
uniref:Uncharacterized protein n=1 Tax=Anopheles atroparvus TaxID=41427 RepID=A0AAG5DIA7_ANOAO